jgi:hypothetical protein
MTTIDNQTWLSANQEYLMAALSRIRSALERHGKHTQPAAARDSVTAEAIETAMAEPPALERLTAAFRLSPFERDLLLLCAGVELDASFAALCAEANSGRSRGPTFSLALAALDGPHWSALAPTSPLRYWKMIELGPGESLVTSPLRIDERVLHYLAGVHFLEERLHGFVEPWLSPGELPPTQQAVADRIAALWSNAAGSWPPVQLCGEEDAGLPDVAAAACASLGLGLHVLSAAAMPVAATDRELLLRLWAREAVLTDSALLLAVDGSENAEALRATAAFAEQAQGALLVAGREPLRLSKLTPMRFDVRKPDSAEQIELWRESLGPLALQLNGQIEALVSQFSLGRSAIAAASQRMLQAHSAVPSTAGALLWDTCRSQSRARLDDLAQRLETTATWDDLVLPSLQLQILHGIVTHVRQRAKVYDAWGFAAKSSRGLGISALFVGPSGTGKTLAAEILANELRLDLYRIDLSQVVSKYIGETEKNLRRVFDAAEASGAVLLFDEADALFGKRSEVKDSHDRYANIEVGYLLQRMEAYRGLAVLTTNMRQALDPAFTRRIRFIVQFPFPDAAQRAEIWRRVFPVSTPVERLNVERLARLNVAGGNIRNIALGAAFLAADEGVSVRMEHLLRATRAEYAKLERPLTDAEIAEWV